MKTQTTQETKYQVTEGLTLKALTPGSRLLSVYLNSTAKTKDSTFNGSVQASFSPLIILSFDVMVTSTTSKAERHTHTTAQAARLVETRIPSLLTGTDVPFA